VGCRGREKKGIRKIAYAIERRRIVNQILERTKTNLRLFSIASGALLILCGVAALPLHRLDLDATLILVTGVSLLAVGSGIKRTTLIAVGCLLCGAGMGILMYAGPLNIPTENKKVLIVLSFSLGWFLIPLFTGLFTGTTRWLACMPGALMAILAGVILTTQAKISWILQAFLLNQSLSSLIVSADLILIGLALTFPWRRMTQGR
jgi:hypothetical protein